LWGAKSSTINAINIALINFSSSERCVLVKGIFAILQLDDGANLVQNPALPAIKESTGKSISLADSSLRLISSCSKNAGQRRKIFSLTPFLSPG